MVIVKKTFEDHDKNLIPTFTNYILMLNKFALKMFNQLSHNWKINRLFIVSYLFNLLDYYFSKVVMKTINITLLKIKFLLILSNQNFYQSNNIVGINNAKVRSYSMYKYYAYHDFTFKVIIIYKYFWFVSIVK